MAVIDCLTRAKTRRLESNSSHTKTTTRRCLASTMKQLPSDLLPVIVSDKYTCIYVPIRSLWRSSCLHLFKADNSPSPAFIHHSWGERAIKSPSNTSTQWSLHTNGLCSKGCRRHRPCKQTTHTFTHTQFRFIWVTKHRGDEKRQRPIALTSTCVKRQAYLTKAEIKRTKTKSLLAWTRPLVISNL